MSFALLHKLVAYLLAGLGLFGLSLGGEMSTPVIFGFGIAYVASYFAEGDYIRSDRYSNAWTGAVVIALLLQLVRIAIDGFSLAVILEFAGFLQLSRLFNRRTAVDYQQIAVLSFLHLIAATTLSTSLAYALVFFGFLIATPWMLTLSHLRREIEGNYPGAGRDDSAAAAAIRRVLASKRVVGAGFLVGTALLTLPLFAMTLAIFFMVPRVGKGFLTLSRDSGQQVTGFGGSVELGDFGVIRDDPTVVLRVTPLPERAEPDPTLVLRLRGTSFDRYDGRTWHRSDGSVRRLRRSNATYPIVRWPDENTDRALRIVLDHLDESVVFVPEGVIAVAVEPRYISGSVVGRQLVLKGRDELRYTDDDQTGLVYTTYATNHPVEASDPGLTREELDPFLQVPPGHQRVAELAAEITANLPTDAERVRALLRYLRESGRYTYTLDLPDVGTAAPLEAFLFDTRRGHCEYFSTALAIMARTVGVPTRNVTGFLGGAYNTYGKYYALRQGDAHSWVEVFIKGRGWVTADPTPSGASRMSNDGVVAKLRALLDAMRTRWMTSVIAYDLRTQISALRRIGEWASQFRDRSAKPKQDDASERIGGNIPWRAIGMVFVAIAAVALIITLRRKVAPTRRRALSRDELVVVQLYRALEQALDKRGCPRPASVTPLEHARALRDAGFPEGASVVHITERYMQVRYGAHELRDKEASQLKQQVAELKQGPRFDRKAA